MVERLLGLGARHLDIGQGEVPWVVLGDVEGNPFCVMEPRPAYVDTGPVAALPLDTNGTSPAASDTTSIPCAIRSPNADDTAHSASLCCGCQSPVSAANETTSASVTASRGEGDTMAPRAASGAARSGLRLKTVSRAPASSSRPAIPEPMMPRPRKAMRVFVRSEIMDAVWSTKPAALG